MAKIWVEAYGCSASFADSEMISGLIVNGGHTLAQDPAESDLNLIVTCSVKDATASKMVHRIKQSESKPLVVAGCLPKAERQTVEKFAHNASMMGPNSIGKTLQVIETTLGGSKIVVLEDTDLSKVGIPKIRLNPIVGIIEIANGCMRDIGEDLSSLIDQVIQIPEDFRIRIGMMNPMFMPRIRDNLLKSFENDKVFRFLHVPVQSGSNEVLNNMKRGHTVETFKDVVKKFRIKFDSFTISTDIIVGYPTETRENFEETIELLEETRPDIVNLSRYSQRPGTVAADMAQVDAAEIKRRSKQVTELINRISLENNKKWIGWEGEVLFDESLDGQIKGRNFAYKPIFVNAVTEIGQTCPVRVVDATNHSLIGEIAS